MTDRELLEFAAKAAGYDVDFNNEQLDRFWVMDTGFWNPLTNDGDALRLAVKLSFDIKVFEGLVIVDDIFGSGWSEIYDNDPYAATRRAITSAAAEIGKGNT